MPSNDLAQIELLAEIDALARRFETWAQSAPPWTVAETCRAIIARLSTRLASLRIRLESPLVIAILGGTGTGKSSLINALAGAELVRSGRGRPTTLRPTLLCRPDFGPEMLGINPAEVDLIQQDIPALANLVLVDCPDPDTTDSQTSSELGTPSADSTLARLRRILPHCDVLIVAATQQKYRSARVSDELSAAAPGARLVFVQTHADRDADIRDDWRLVLAAHYEPGHIFLVDSVTALVDAQQGRAPQGEFAALADLLTRQFVGTAAARIRRDNFLDLAADALAACRRRLDEAMPRIKALQTAVNQQRAELSKVLAQQVRIELLASRRPWENRLLGHVTSRWGFSPFALVLRIYQGIGGLASGALLYRARTPAQLALWGVVEGARTWQAHRSNKQLEERAGQAAAGGFDPVELRRAALVLEGYTIDAGLPRASASPETIAAEAEGSGLDFASRLSQDLNVLIVRQAERHTGWFTRAMYEFLLLAMLGFLLFRLGKNFFYDSWWSHTPVPLWGVESYLTAAFWLVLWCLLLLWLFTRRLRGGLRQSIDKIANNWTGAGAASGIFARLESDCRRSADFRDDLARLESDVEHIRGRMSVHPSQECGGLRPEIFKA